MSKEPEQQYMQVYAFRWKDRSGIEHRARGIQAISLVAARAYAKQHYAYPGHRGGWWNYFVDDSEKFFRKMGWIK